MTDSSSCEANVSTAQPSGASPASAGPSGALLEGQVAASYCLAMLTGAAVRGLPGAMIDRIRFQRGDEGHPMDDLIIDAHDSDGREVGLDVQIKRSITFAPGDVVFGKAAGQIARSLTNDGPSSSRTLAIATAHISRKIAGPYQAVLTWARAVESPTVFHTRLNREGAASPDMGRFVETLRGHLATHGAPDDDESLWRLLRRLRILVFDFTASESASLTLALQQCALALHPDEASRGTALWSALIEIALASDAVGGAIDRAQLIEAIRDRGFRLAGDRRSAGARRALAEASAFATAAIDDAVGGATLLRPERVAAINAALDRGRYVEIRGAGGVGKSGLLKQLAQSIEGEGVALVLRPTRVTGHGWAAMRSSLGYDGQAHELLAELVAAGGDLMLIDNLEGFTVEERATVVDLVRAAAVTPGLSLVVTARLDFAADEPSWLPVEALDAMGRSPVVTVEELTEGEVAALKAVAPALAELLADRHPARAVVRNLFRLKRLARYDAGVDIHTELELARRWWLLADGDEAGRRDRARLLRRLGTEVLISKDRHDVSAASSEAVEALIRSETLSDAGAERVVFRHDVLRDWAVFNTLQEEPHRVGELPLRTPAPASLARGFELYARHLISEVADGSAWGNLLDSLEAAGAHGSWRRTALLGVLRADNASALLSAVIPRLLADDGGLMRELIRTVMAVEVQRADALYAALGVDLALVPKGLTAPHGPSWFVLIEGLSTISDQLPPETIPSVVDLYTQWLMVAGRVLASARVLVRQLYGWLVVLQDGGGHSGGMVDDHFASLPRDERSALLSSTRNAFVAFASATPDLALDYIKALKAGRRSSEAAASAVMFCGSLPEAAADAYADLVAHLLIEPEERPRGRGEGRREPFSFLDHRFLPPSPAQGPFLELLRVAPEAGQRLIRRLVDHEIAHDLTQGATDDGFEIGFAGDRRRVRAAWAYSYARHQARGHAVESGLMALEAWAHDRVEAGEDLEALIDQLLDGPDLSAPFVLVAVDVILSHWDERAARKAIDLVASPELLVLDRGRQGREMFAGVGMDWFGLGSLSKEPGRGRYTAEALRGRPSRQLSLERTLPVYIAHSPSHDRLATHYAEEAARLGPPSEYAAFDQPSFMAAYVLNLLNPANWVAHDGPEGGRIYRSPPEEEGHLARLRARSGTNEVELRLALTNAADPEADAPASPTLVDLAARRLAEPIRASDGSAFDDDRQIRAQAALVIARDADEVTWHAHEAVVIAALQGEIERSDDHFGGGMSQLRYNPPGLAFVGLAHRFRRAPGRDAAEAILRVAVTGGMAAAQGFKIAAPVLDAADSRLMVASLRCAMVGGRQVHRRWVDEEAEELAGREVDAARADALRREINWLFEGAEEPPWPPLMSRRPERRRGLSLTVGTVASTIGPEEPDEDPDHFFNHQSAASWLGGALRASGGPWVEAFVSRYGPWTMAANGLGLEPFADPDVRLHEWNRQFAEASVRTLAQGGDVVFEKLILEPLPGLPDRMIHDLASDLLRSLDRAVFQDHSVTLEAAARVRRSIAAAVTGTRGWRAASGVFSTSIEHGLGPAAAALFFCEHLIGEGPSAYLTDIGVARVGPFLPLIMELTRDCPSFFVALAFLSLAEVKPSPEFVEPAIVAGEAWIKAFPDHDVFWSDQRIGKRICGVLEGALPADAGLDLGGDLGPRLDALLSKLVALGVKEAFALEQRIHGFG